jgi:hypothetical protein
LVYSLFKLSLHYHWHSHNYSKTWKKSFNINFMGHELTIIVMHNLFFHMFVLLKHKWCAFEICIWNKIKIFIHNKTLHLIYMCFTHVLCRACLLLPNHGLGSLWCYYSHVFKRCVHCILLNLCHNCQMLSCTTNSFA